MIDEDYFERDLSKLPPVGRDVEWYVMIQQAMSINAGEEIDAALIPFYAAATHKWLEKHPAEIGAEEYFRCVRPYGADGVDGEPIEPATEQARLVEVTRTVELPAADVAYLDQVHAEIRTEAERRIRRWADVAPGIERALANRSSKL